MKLYIIIPVTILIIMFSWYLSVKHGRYHGVARFFAFESIFLLILINLPAWFQNPAGPVQILSWIMLICSIYFAVTGFLLLQNAGKPVGGNFENTSVLVKKGIYGYIRHPLYFSLFLLGTGAFLKQVSYLTLLLAILNMVALWLTARIEESEMIARFGDEYRDYMKETKMFIPFIL
ncbi:MAG: isoprenylcysteine carboxylmethyltransferase family protein [Bacteroidales bacterium]